MARHGTVEAVVVAAVFAVLGGWAGGGVRLLLGRLRGGAGAGAGRCEALLARSVGRSPGCGWAVGAACRDAWLPLLLGLGWLGVAAGAVDVLHRRLPDALTLPAIPAGLLLLCPVGAGAVARRRGRRGGRAVGLRRGAPAAHRPRSAPVT